MYLLHWKAFFKYISMSNTGKDAADTEMIQSQNFQETDYGRYNNVQYHKTVSKQ